MNEEFKSIIKYCAINKLSINFSKTNYILVSSSRLSGSINVNNIKIKSQIQYLGVYIDQHLHWGPQIKHINNKLAKNTGIITKLRHCVNLHTMKQLYYSFFYPYLTYAYTSWGSACKTNLNRIRTEQNKCICSIFFAHSREDATSYYNLLDILKLITFSNLKQHSLHITSLTIQQASQQYSLELSLQLPTAIVIILEFLTLTSTGHKQIITMELPLFRSLRRKYRRLFHCCLKNYVTTASLNTSSYICLMCNLFPRIYIDLVYFSLTTFSHVLLFIFSLFCSLFYFYFLFNASQYCYFSTFSLFV